MERLLRVSEVADRVGLSIREVWRRVAAGRFPKPARLGPRVTRFREADINAYIRNCFAQPDRRDVA